MPPSFQRHTSFGDAPITSVMPTELKELYDQIVAAIKDWTDMSNNDVEFNEYHGAPQVDIQLVTYIAPLNPWRLYSHLRCLYAQPCAHCLTDILKTMGLTTLFESGKLKTVEVRARQEQPDLIGTNENALMRMSFERECVLEDDSDDWTAFPHEETTPPPTALVLWIDHESTMRKLSIDQDVLARQFWRSLSFLDRQLYFHYLSIYQEHLTPYLVAKAAWDHLVNARPFHFGSDALQALYRDWEDCEPEFYDLPQNVIERAKVLPEWEAFRKMKNLQGPVDPLRALIQEYMVPEIKFMQRWDEEKDNRKAKGKRVVTVACEDPDNAGAWVVVEVLHQPVAVSLPDPDLVTDFDEWVIYDILGIQCMADWHFEDEIPQAVLDLAANWEMGKGHTLPREPTFFFDLELVTNVFEQRFGGLVKGKKRADEEPDREPKRPRLATAVPAPTARPVPTVEEEEEEEEDQSTSGDQSSTPTPTSNSRDATPDSVGTSATSVEEVTGTVKERSSQDIPQQSADCSQRTETSSSQPEPLQAAQDQAPSANPAPTTEASSAQPKDSQAAEDQAQSGTLDAPQPEQSQSAQGHPQSAIASGSQLEAQVQPATPASLTEASGAQPDQVQSAQAEPQSATPAPSTEPPNAQPPHPKPSQAPAQSATPSATPSKSAALTVSPDPTLLQNVGFAFQDLSGNIPMCGYEIPRGLRWKNKRRVPDDEECDDSGYSSTESEPRKKMKMKGSS